MTKKQIDKVLLWNSSNLGVEKNMKNVKKCYFESRNAMKCYYSFTPSCCMIKKAYAPLLTLAMLPFSQNCRYSDFCQFIWPPPTNRDRKKNGLLKCWVLFVSVPLYVRHGKKSNFIKIWDNFFSSNFFLAPEQVDAIHPGRLVWKGFNNFMKRIQ